VNENAARLKELLLDCLIMKIGTEVRLDCETSTAANLLMDLLIKIVEDESN